MPCDNFRSTTFQSKCRPCRPFFCFFFLAIGNMADRKWKPKMAHYIGLEMAFFVLSSRSKVWPAFWPLRGGNPGNCQCFKTSDFKNKSYETLPINFRRQKQGQEKQTIDVFYPSHTRNLGIWYFVRKLFESKFLALLRYNKTT